MKNHYGYKHLRVSLLICLRLRWYGIERVELQYLIFEKSNKDENEKKS